MKTCNKLIALLLMLTLAAILFSGCELHISFGIGGYVTGESYSNAEAYQTGAFTYEADEVKSIEIYWRSGEVELIESDEAELSARESGGELPEEAAMHYLLEDGTLRIRFCESGAKLHVHSNDKHLTIEIPKGIDLSVHTTSASVKADALHQNSILISAHSGRTELGSAEAESIDLSSSSGSIRADSISAQTLKCSTSSGSVQIDALAAERVDVETSSGSVDLTFTAAVQADIRTSSGRTSLRLPEGGAEIAYSASSGTLHAAENFEQNGELYVFGRGESRITVKSSSGSLVIR
ncbi:MAG: DUF4097 family beta strand repeat-containing protein [bacterium]|nr:DUF4097 family beta strand repeat-containing protein [bacterium]